MEALLGRVLATFLDGYVKNAHEKFVNWSLADLEFKEDVVQQLFEIPPYLEVERATCTSIHADVSWFSVAIVRLAHDTQTLSRARSHRFRGVRCTPEQSESIVNGLCCDSSTA